MRMKCFLITLFSTVAIYPVHADDGLKLWGGDITGSVTAASEYASRGLTQDNENPALQGGLTYKHDLTSKTKGYVGVWGSNVNFNDGGEAKVELDGLGGVIYEVGPVSFDTGLVYYAYPGAAGHLNYDYIEAIEKVTYTLSWMTLSGAVHYSPDNFAKSGQSFYYEGNANVPLPKNFALTGHVGRSQIEDNAAFLLPDYTDWSAGVVYSYKGFDFAINYVDTSINQTACARGCEGRAVFSITKNF